MKSICRVFFTAWFWVSAHAYYLDTDSSGIYVYSWDPGTIAMQIKLPTSPTLQDGTNFATSVQAAMQAWNGVMGAVQFSSQIVSTVRPAPDGTYSNGDRINQVVIDSTYDGTDFGTGVLAITLSFTSGNSLVESDIVFNTNWSWDSYRGNLNGQQDIRRVAIHELGHVLGLNHPDQANPPQPNAIAIMNSRVSNFDTLQADDIAGARLLYGAPGFVPGNDNFANAVIVDPSNGSAQMTGTNIGATRETNEPRHAGADAPVGHSVWWRWTAPSNGSTTVTTLGSNFDTVMAVYTGSAVGSLTVLGSNDDVTNGQIRTSTVTFSAIGGTTYSIAVDGWGSFAQRDQFTPTGAITLNVAFSGSIGSAPTITTQPASQTVNLGSSVTFSATASGSPAPSYQWRKNSSNIAGATNASYTIATVSSGSAGSYSVVATNPAGSAASNGATLTVITPPSSAIISITVE